MPQVHGCLSYVLFMFLYEENINDIISSCLKIVMFLPSSLKALNLKNKKIKQLIPAECVISELQNVKCDAGYHFTQFKSVL